jgi:hypothetical protein
MTKNAKDQLALTRAETKLAQQGTQLAQQQQRLVVAQTTASAILAVAESVRILSQGRTYRANLAAIIQSLQTDQTIRHADVDKMLEILDQCGPDMSPTVRDQFYSAMLVLLSSSNLRDKLPAPPDK